MGAPTDLPIAGGVDQHGDARKLEPGRLISAVNASIVKSGKLSKRYGTTSIPTAAYTQAGATAFVAPLELGARGTETLVMERSRLFTRVGNKSASKYIQALSDFTCREQSFAQGNGSNLQGNSAFTSDGKYVAYTWVADWTFAAGTTTTIVATVVDRSTGAVVIPPTAIAQANTLDTPKIIAMGSVFWLLWSSPNGNKIFTSRLDMAGALPLAWGGTSTPIANLGTSINGAWDVTTDGTTYFYVVYKNTGIGTANQMNLVKYDINGTQVAINSSVSVGTVNAITSFGIALFGTATLWIAYGLGAGSLKVVAGTVDTATLAAFVGFFDAYTEPASAPTSVIVVPQSASVAIVGGSQQLSAPNTSKFVVFNVGGGAVGPVRTQNASIIQSKGINYLSKVYVLMATLTPNIVAGEPTQGTIELCEVVAAGDTATANVMLRPVCTWGPRVSPEGGGRFNSVAELFLGADGKIHTVGPRTTANVSGQDGTGVGTGQGRVAFWDLTFDPDQSQRQSAELGGLTYVSGGVPSWYDGQRVGECSFLQYGHAKAGAAIATGGLTQNATYQYAIVFAHWDSAGNVHRSAPTVVSVVLGASGTGWKVPLTINYLNLTTRQDAYQSAQKVTVEIYRTPASTTGDGATFRRITPSADEAAGVTQSSTGTLRNDPSSSTFVFTDTATDGSLAGQPLLYTMGGALDNVSPPSARLVCVHRQRLWIAGCPDGKEMWASKKLTKGEAPGFNEGLVQYVDDGGDITAIASMDDKLVIFKSDRIFFITGDGPTDAGTASDWGDPIRIASTVGSTSPYVLVTPMGIVFRSKMGLSLLTRSLEVQPFWGSAVEDHLANFPLTSGMMLHPSLPEIRVLVSRNAPGSSAAEPDTFGLLSLELRFDYRANQGQGAWLPAGYLHDFDIVLGFAQVQSCAALGGVPYYLNSHPSLWYEDPTTFLDGGSQYVGTVLEFAPVASAGVQGYQEFRSLAIVGDRYTDHDLTIKIAYDDFPYTDTGQVLAATSRAWATAGEAYQVLMSPPSSNKCERFRVRLSDAFNLGTQGIGKGFALSSISFDVEPKDGINPQLPATHLI